MSRLSFNHVFLSLLSLAAVCAFLVPVQQANHLRGWLDAAFAPVAYPVRRLAQVALNRGLPAGPADASRMPDDAKGEIRELRAKVASLTVQL
ncbi:MAG: hypothetical protein ACM359_22770, partial [Bacillota bacterium]